MHISLQYVELFYRSQKNKGLAAPEQDFQPLLKITNAKIGVPYNLEKIQENRQVDDYFKG
jgi:hypothetical protein